MKTFYLRYNVGKVKYLISFHNGKKTHPDGSKFYDIKCLKSKEAVKTFRNELIRKGYVETL